MKKSKGERILHIEILTSTNQLQIERVLQISSYYIERIQEVNEINKNW